MCKLVLLSPDPPRRSLLRPEERRRVRAEWGFRIHRVEQQILILKKKEFSLTKCSPAASYKLLGYSMYGHGQNKNVVFK